MKTQAELIEAERRLDRLEKYLVETFPSDERTRRASAATELLAAPISPWGQSNGDGLALGALRKVSKEARRARARDEDEDGDEAPPSAAQKLSAWQEKERRRLAAEGAKAKHEEARALEAAAGAAERQRVVDMQSRLGHTRSELARLSRVSSVDGGGARRLSAAVQAVGVVAAGFAGPPTAALATPTTTAATAAVASRPRCGCASSTASATRAPPHPSAVASAAEAAGTGVAPVLWLCSPFDRLVRPRASARRRRTRGDVRARRLRCQRQRRRSAPAHRAGPRHTAPGARLRWRCIEPDAAGSGRNPSPRPSPSCSRLSAPRPSRPAARAQASSSCCARCASGSLPSRQWRLPAAGAAGAVAAAVAGRGKAGGGDSTRRRASPRRRSGRVRGAAPAARRHRRRRAPRTILRRRTSATIIWRRCEPWAAVGSHA